MFNLLNKKIGKKNTKGFTLIELVVVIAIVAVLAAVGIPAIAGQVKKSQDATATSNAKLIAQSASQLLTNQEAAGLDITDPTSAQAMTDAGISSGKCDITYVDVLDPADSTKKIGRAVQSVKYTSANGKSEGTFTRTAAKA